MSTNNIIKKSMKDQRQMQRKQQFKKKYRHRKIIADHVVQQFQQNEILQFIEEKTSSLIKKPYYPLYTGSHIDSTIFLSNYLIISDKDFKKICLTSAMTLDVTTKSLKKLLKINESLLFIRQLTQLINTLHYLEIQNEQWNYYYHLGKDEGIWTRRVSKNMATINSMPNTYGRSKVLIKQRQKKYQNDLDKINNDINKYMTQMPNILTSSIDQIMTITRRLINQDEYQLRMELERSRTILKFDAYNHQLVQSFYNLKPRQTEIHSAKLIWKAIHDEYKLRYELALFKNWLLTSKSTPLTLYTFQDLRLAKINDIFTHMILNKQFFLFSNRNHSTAHGIDSINQSIEKKIQETISTTETYLEKYVQKINNEKQKLLNNQEKFKKPPSVQIVISAIEDCQSNMVQRAEFNIEQTLKILFPTIDINI